MSSSYKNALAMQGGGSPFIEGVAGAEKGKVVELAGERLTIGRAADNDIVVTSEGVSRVHAFLMMSDGAWFIRDNNSKNGIQVNGNAVTEAWLQNGDVVQVGTFVFRFREPGAAPAENPMGDVRGIEGGVGEAPKKKPNRRILIYGVLGLVLALVYMQSNTPPAGEGNKDEAAVTGEGTDKKTDKLARDFEAAKEPSLVIKEPARLKGIEDPALKAAETEMAKLDWTNSALREAEQFFRKGQREYMAKSYHRAIESFQTALAFYRGHILAEKYLRRSMYEVEVEAKGHMELGVQYFEALQYQRAIYHFTEVVNLMQHRPTEAIVNEAERYILLSKKRLQAAELFP